MKEAPLNDCRLCRLPHGMLFHPAAAFDPADGRPVVAIVSNLELFPVLHGSYVVVMQMTDFLKRQGFRPILVNQSRTAVDGRAFAHQAVCDRYFDATLHITQATPRADAAAGDAAAAETLHGLRWLEERFGRFAAIAEYAYMSPALSALSARALKLVQTIDVVSRLSLADLRKNRIDFRRGLSADEEAALLTHADVLIAITDVARRILADMIPGKRVVTVGCAVEPVARGGAPDDCHDLLFIASSNPFNQDGARHFITEVLPRIRQAVPDARLLLGGEVCSKLRAEEGLLDTPGVVALGPVDAVEPLHRATAVMINPTRFGTGLKIKTVEALAAGKAVVATAVGSEGLPAAAEPPFIVADHPADFAAACVRLLCEPARRRELERNALDYARRHFSMDAVYRELQAALDDWRGRSGPARPSVPAARPYTGRAADLLGAALADRPGRIFEIGYPSRGHTPTLTRSVPIARHDSLPPIATLDELDYQWQAARPSGDDRRAGERLVFHRLTPEQYLADHAPAPAYDLLYVHGEPRRDRLLWNLLSFAPGLAPGGSVAVDDFGDPAAPGITAAVDEFILLALPAITAITCAPAESASGWPPSRQTAGRTILLTLRSGNIACGLELDRLIHPPEPAAAGAPPKPLGAILVGVLVRQRLEALCARGDPRVAIFGAGAHTAWLESVCLGLPLNVVAVLDENPAGRRMVFGLKPIKPQDFDPGAADVIVLSSDASQRAMTFNCRERFGDRIELLDLYHGLPPGPYAK